MSVMKRKDSRDLDSCYDYESFVKVLDDKVSGWVILAETFKREKVAAAASPVIQGDMQTFQKFLTYVQDYFSRNRENASGDFAVWQNLRLYALTLESLAGLITDSYLSSVLSKLDTRGGLVDKNQIIADAQKMQSMNDHDYCNHILDECILLISDIQGDDREDGIKPDPRLEDFRLQIEATRDGIRRQGTAIGPEDRQKVDKIVGEAMEYTVNKLSEMNFASSKKPFAAPLRGPGKSGSGLN